MAKSGSKDVVFEAEKQPDGSLRVQVSFESSKLIGKQGTFSITRKCTVKDKRPVHKEIKLFSESFTASSSGRLFIIPANRLRSTAGGYPYDGAKVKIETRAEVSFRQFLAFSSKYHASICSALPDPLPHRAKVKNNAQQLIDPKDAFNFFKNFAALSPSDQISTVLRIVIGFSIAGANAFVGYHDQMSPEQWTWFYSHVDSDGDSQSPLLNALGISFGVLVLSWLGVKKELRKYMSLHFKLSFKRVKINRESEVLVGDMVTGVSRVNLYDATLRVVACNMECGQYVRGSGSNRRTISFRNPNRAVLLFSKKIPMIEKGRSVDSYFPESLSFKPMFQALYPPQMVGEVHGLDLVWEVQLLVDDFIDQELIGNNLRLEKKDFYSA